MDNSLITIIIALLLLFFQVFTEKKRKEAKRQAALKKREPLPDQQNIATESSSPFDFIYESLLKEPPKETAKSTPVVTKADASIVTPFDAYAKEASPFDFAEGLYSPADSGMDEKTVENTSVPLSAVLPKKDTSIAFVPDKEFMQEEDEAAAKAAHEKVDPRLLILYSEIMTPKFRD